MRQVSVGNKIKDYYEVTKPKIWYLLVFTTFGAALTASFYFDLPIEPMTWVLLIGGVTAGSAAAETLTGYIDRDIDAMMDRTKDRPIPSGRISPKNALAFGLILTAISLVMSWFVNIWAFSLMAFGLFDNVIVYSKWLKRRSQSNIILGGFSGGAPALIGYVAVTTQNIEIGLVMAGLVFLWIPTHIWSLALHIKKDYTKAGVPMLPVVSSEKSSVRVIAGTTVMMVVFSLVPFLFGEFGIIYLATAGVFGAVMLALSMWLLVKPTEKASWTVFKFSSPYLTALFIAFMVDAYYFTPPG
ncbi:heme o synthase [Nitrososphaera viennensis]|uniref:Protoheme IX farnesyltransferase n=1 Tax=Nitrososphaera viennensis TaxID=1034015 RepID=A0A977IGK5_9ARCH|nr:heme o synthase [Nitrososphaera viennensis]UVS70649.1 heme o synthase [Nitrososphaera viennensis]